MKKHGCRSLLETAKRIGGPGLASWTPFRLLRKVPDEAGRKVAHPGGGGDAEWDCDESHQRGDIKRYITSTCGGGKP